MCAFCRLNGSFLPSAMHYRSVSIAKRRRRTFLGYRIYYCSSCLHQFNERTGSPFNDLQFPTDIVLLAVLWRFRYKLGFRDVAELLLQRGFVVSHETIRTWEYRFAPLVRTIRQLVAPSDGRGQMQGGHEVEASAVKAS